MTEVVTRTEPPLDDLMLAMDVVDTLRHGEALVERELSDEVRRARMIERLREIYRGQGLEVPDRILAEGVEALEQDRFVYRPRARGLAVTLARLYVRRGVVARRAALAAALALLAWGAFTMFVTWPRERAVVARRLAEEARAADDARRAQEAARAAEALRVELAETLPARLAELRRQVADEAQDAAVAQAADVTARDGTAAAAAGDAAAARTALASLERTLAELLAVFDVRVVSRPGEPSGLTRIPDDNPDVENCYLIVEAVGADGRALRRSITSEEDQTTREVTRWGVRVPEDVFERVADDKRDDGIVQAAVLGTKRRGLLDVGWTIPVPQGAITEWAD